MYAQFAMGCAVVPFADGSGFESEVELVSGSSDKSVIVWRREAGDVWAAATRFTECTSSISAVSAVYLQDGDPGAAVVTAVCIDGTLHVWTRSPHGAGHVTAAQTRVVLELMCWSLQGCGSTANRTVLGQPVCWSV